MKVCLCDGERRQVHDIGTATTSYENENRPNRPGHSLADLYGFKVLEDGSSFFTMARHKDRSHGLAAIARLAWAINSIPRIP